MRGVLGLAFRRVLLVMLAVTFEREHEVHEDEQAENEALHEADEDLEAGEGDREARQEEQPAHDDEHDLAAEHVAPEPERERGHAEELAEELDEADEHEDEPDEHALLEATEVEPARGVAEAVLAEAIGLVGDERDER